MPSVLQPDQHSIFFESGGYFPVAVKHKEKIFIFCRTGAGHLGQNGKIAVLSSDNGLDWHLLSVVERANTDIRNPAVYIFPNGDILLAVYKYNAYNVNGICSPSENNASYNYDLLFFISKDGGISLNECSDINQDLIREAAGRSPHGNMISYDNQILLPVYGKKGCFLVSSKDNGKNWDVFSHIANDLLEPFAVINAKNELVAVMRSSGKIYFSFWKKHSLFSFLIK